MLPRIAPLRANYNSLGQKGLSLNLRDNSLYQSINFQILSSEISKLNQTVTNLAQVLQGIPPLQNSQRPQQSEKVNKFNEKGYDLNDTNIQQSVKRMHLEGFQQRFKQIIIAIPQISQEIKQKRQEQIKRFVSDITNQIFSQGFYYLQQSRLSQTNYRLFCCHNLLSNLIKFNQINKLSDKQIELIDDHLKKWVLLFLKTKYPQSQNNQSNIKLSSIINDIENFNINSNDLVMRSKVEFRKKTSGDYSKQIMQVLNYAINLSRQIIQDNKTLYTRFHEQMQQLFTKLQDQKWVLEAKSGRFQQIQYIKNKVEQSIEQKAEKQKYQQKVQQYTKYLIGKKISDNVPTYSTLQINDQSIKIKSPSIMRILTKWCIELQQLFDTNTSINQRPQMFKMRDGSERYLSSAQKRILIKNLQKQKANIMQFLNKIKSNLYQNQQFIASSNTPQNFFRNFCGKNQSAVGYLTSIMTISNQNYLINYLNKLIDSILTVEQLWMKQMNHKSQFKQQIPSLVCFRIGDLLRCKCSSKQTQITALYGYLKFFCLKYPNKLEIIRVRNRLGLGTKDILINMRFLNKATIQMQLSVNQDKSNFMKYSAKANHFIYELQRASFGPISQLSSICCNVDQRSPFYSKVFMSKNQWQKVTQRKQQQCNHEWENTTLPIWCSLCKKFHADFNIITHHKKCLICKTKICCKCIISNGELEQIPISLSWIDCIKNLKDILKIEIIDLQKKQIERKTLILRRYQNKLIFFQYTNEQQSLFFNQEVKNQKQAQFIKKLISQKQITQIYTIDKKQKQKLMKISNDILLKRQFLSYHKNLKKMFTYEDKELPNQFLKHQQFKLIKKVCMIKTDMKQISYMPNVFPNCQIAILNKNFIRNFKQLSNWKLLKQLSLEQNNIEDFPSQIFQLTNLQLLKMKRNRLTKVPSDIKNLKLLKHLNLQQNNIAQVSQDIGFLSNLQVLWLKQNKITNIPKSMHKLLKLKVLIIERNNFINIPPEFSQLVNLQVLNISQNQITELPQDLFKNMTKLLELWCYKNKLLKLPSSIVHLRSLTRLSIFQNKIKQIKRYIKQLKNLSILNVCYNQIVDQNQFNGLYNEEMSSLVIHHNQITNFPQDIYLMKNLKELSADSLIINPINQIFNLKKLQQLSLCRISLQSLPQQIVLLKHLKKLQLVQNKLKQLPKNIVKLIQLEQLDLQKNLFTQFPVQICQIPKLIILSISDNYFKTIPAQIGNMTNLMYIYMESQHLTHIDNNFERLEELTLVTANYAILDDSTKQMYHRMATKIARRFRQNQEI